ncbi:solute carrier family 35 member E1 homolog [Venturia canescens]|uniref:solute carrier family 35 member E1 homolog n=1 Tax=Venturia canescens TaxID=32260 RepID=UPI001C9D3BAC|nr:solute carrier family 35 member E1 homolog [Venturia canescens]
MEKKTDETKQPLEILVKVPLQTETRTKEEPTKSWKIPFLCLIWFLATICNMFAVKIFLRVMKFEFASTIMIVQLASTSLYTWIFSIIWGVPKNNKEVSRLTYVKLILPVAVSIFIRTRIKSYLIWTTPISDPFSLSVDALYPLCMLLFARKLLAEEENIDYGFALLVAVLGGGFVFGFTLWDLHRLWLIEIVAFAIMIAFEMVFSKKIMQETGIHPTKLLAGISAFVLLGLVPIWLVETQWLFYLPYTPKVLCTEVITGLFVFGALTFVQTAAAFGLLSTLPVHHYLIGNGCNRMIRIVTFMLVATFYEIGYRAGDFDS